MTSPIWLRCVAGMTFSRPILAVLNMPQRIFDYGGAPTACRPYRSVDPIEVSGCPGCSPRRVFELFLTLPLTPDTFDTFL